MAIIISKQAFVFFRMVVVSMKFEGVTSPERSELMKKIRSSGTSPEINLRKALWIKGYRYRKNYKKLPGTPDIYLPKYKIAIFVDGEFWHGFDWDRKKERIKSNKEFWVKKIESNMNRDATNYKLLQEMGCRVLRFWGQEVKKDLAGCIKRVDDTVSIIINTTQP